MYDLQRTLRYMQEYVTCEISRIGRRTCFVSRNVNVRVRVIVSVVTSRIFVIYFDEEYVDLFLVNAYYRRKKSVYDWNSSKFTSDKKIINQNKQDSDIQSVNK